MFGIPVINYFFAFAPYKIIIIFFKMILIKKLVLVPVILLFCFGPCNNLLLFSIKYFLKGLI